VAPSGGAGRRCWFGSRASERSCCWFRAKVAKHDSGGRHLDAAFRCAAARIASSTSCRAIATVMYVGGEDVPLMCIIMTFALEEPVQ
jgi:hypothetical protein